MARMMLLGICECCGGTVTRAGAARHHAACGEFQAAVARAARSRRRIDRLFQLRVQDAERGDFWLDLEMRGLAPLAELDAYLRAIWLECCGHLSRFSVGGWSGDELPKLRRAGDAFAEHAVLTHIYDFGTESVTRVRVIGVRDGRPLTTHAITLLARNVMPAKECADCGGVATHLCMECVIEHEAPGTLCDAHTRTHPHREYGRLLRLVNSPRLGLCGYTGPAEPPY